MSALNECPNHIEPAFDLTQVQQTVLGVVSGALKRAGNDGKLLKKTKKVEDLFGVLKSSF